MANPKRKVSKSKRDKRRANWMQNINGPKTSECPNCSEVKMMHRACPSCGYYKGQLVFERKTAE